MLIPGGNGTKNMLRVTIHFHDQCYLGDSVVILSQDSTTRSWKRIARWCLFRAAILHSRGEWQEAIDSPLAPHLHLLWRTNHTVEEKSRQSSAEFRHQFTQRLKENGLTCWMRVSTILYWSGMCVTMCVMLSSEVLTRVGPNTMAKLRGSI